MAKISVSIDDDLLASIHEQTGPEGSVSGWLADAADRKLRAQALDAYADQVEATTGPLTPAELTAARSWLSSATQRS
jgi:hypothetical protein